MLESLNEFRARTAFVWDSLPREGSFATNPKLIQKVGPDGGLLPFFGDTVIFDLPEGEKALLANAREALYAACGEMLAERLDAASFHITLHDLNSAAHQEEIAAEMARGSELARELLSTLPEALRRPVRVRPTAAFSMVNTSVVLGYEPCAEEDCAELMELYERLQGVVRLNYPLTPHATLAYYRPGDYGADGLQRLRGALAELNRNLPPRELCLSDPAYRRFADMNRYFPHP